MFKRNKEAKTNSKDYPLDHKDEWQNVKAVVDRIFQDTKPRRDKMTKFIKMYRGEFWKMNDLDAEDSEIMYNLLFTTVSSIAPLVTDSKPITTVVPKRSFMQKIASAYTMALKYGWDTLDMQMVLAKGCIWAYICGYVVYHIFNDPTKIFGGTLCCEIIDPRDFFVAPGYEEIWKVPYCGYKTLKPISWIKETFPEIKIRPDICYTGDGEDDKEKAYMFSEVAGIADEAQFVKVYCVWMKDQSLVYEENNVTITDEDGKESEKTVTEEHKKFPYGKFMYFTETERLGEIAQEEQHGLPPFVEQIDYYNPGMFSAIGEADQIEGLDKELNLTLQAIANYERLVSNPNYEFDTRCGIDVDTFKRTYREGGQVFAADKEPGYNGTAIQQIQMGTLNSVTYNIVNMIPKIVEDITGVTETTKGLAAKKERQSASELAILAEASNTRTRLKIRFLEWTIKRISYLLVRNMQQYYVEPQMIHDIRDDGVDYLEFSSQKKAMLDNMISPEVLAKFAGKEPGEVDNLVEADEKEQYADYLAFLDVYDDSVRPTDPIFFDFDIEVETDSTLPMDKQSRANLMLRLGQMKFADAEAVLEVLQIPGKDRIIKRLKEQGVAKGAAQNKPQGAVR